jgi:lysophospholipase L1-like esterase
LNPEYKVFWYDLGMRVLIFGDSITQGFWDTDGGWVERIRKHYDSVQVTDMSGRDEPTIFNLGISADNSVNILKRIMPETLARTRHGNLPIIIVQIGVIDSSRDTLADSESVSLSIEKYEDNIRKIVDTIKPFCSKIIFVGLSACDELKTTPVSWGDFHYTNENIKKYEDKMKEIIKANIPFEQKVVDIDEAIIGSQILSGQFSVPKPEWGKEYIFTVKIYKTNFNIEGAKLSDEHTEMGWFDISELDSIKTRDVYREAAKELL